LNAVIADYARDGWTITSVLAGQAVVQKKHRLGSNNFWVGGAFWTIVILLVIFTAGLWLIVIAFWYLTAKTQTVIIRVDERGAVDLS
jgi:cytoskeletal protein RodZ